METTHTSIITWIKQIATKLADAYAPEQLPQVEELDELETFVGNVTFGSVMGTQSIQDLFRRETKL